MKKKKILTILVLMIPLLFTIGFSSWIIMYSFEFSPSYETNPVSDLFNFSNTTTYNGEEQVPYPKDGVTITGDITYQYKLESESTFTTGKPINAGVYDIKITITNSTVNGTCQVKFTINKMKIKFSSSTININYDDCVNTWSAMLVNIKSKVTFKDENNNDLTDFDFANHCQLLGMHNGLYYYGESGYKVNGLTTTTYVAGSTYVGEVTLYDEVAINYEFINGKNKLLIKYKTAIVGGSYCTIEEAIKAQGGTITFAGDSTTASSYIETVFCCLTESDGNPYTESGGYYTEDSVNYKNKKIFTISSGILLVPYKNSTDITEPLESDSATSYVYSCLTIPSNIALVIKSGAQLQIGSILANRGISGMHGVIMNNGIITVESGSYLYSYGYLKGTGIINMNSGSVAYDIMRMYDWPGGSAAKNMSSNAFPVIAWSMHNISCPTKIFKGAKLCGYSSFTVSVIGYQKPDFCVVGASNSESSCLFKPGSNSSSTDYILKSGTSTNNSINTSITESNQSMGQRDIIDIYGDYQDSSLQIGISVMGIYNYNFNTSTSIAVPISYMDVIISGDSNLLISSSSYVFMLGTSLTVHEEATLNISGEAYMAFDYMSGTSADTAIINSWFATNYCKNKVNSQLNVYGTITGTGSLGGIITAKATNAQLATSNFNVLSINMKYDAGNQKEVATNFALYGDIGDASSFSYGSFTSGTSYISTTLDGDDVLDENKEYYFTAATNVKTFILKFYDSDKSTLLGTKNILLLLPDDDGYYRYKLNGKEFIPYKIHYDLDKWILSSNDSEAAGVILIYDSTNSASNTIEMYASWTLHEYSFIYSGGYSETLDSTTVESINDIIYEDAIYKFTISDFVNDKLTITTKASYNEKYFNGWYLGIDSSSGIQINEITKSNVELFVDTYGYDKPIPLYCQFTDYAYFTIYFVDNEDKFSNPESIVYRSDQNISLPNTASYDSNPLNQRYFTYWSFLSSPTEATKVINNSSVQYLINQIKTYNSAQGSTIIDLSNNQITLYAKLSTKAYTLTYQQVDYYENEISKSVYYYNAGGQYEVPIDLSLPGYILNTTEGTSGVEYTGGTPTNGIITVNSNVAVKVHYYKIIKITITDNDTWLNKIKSYYTIINKYVENNQLVESENKITTTGDFYTVQGAFITEVCVVPNSYVFGYYNIGISINGTSVKTGSTSSGVIYPTDYELKSDTSIDYTE